MNKLLNRILLGLVAVLAVLSLFSFTVLKLSDQVRFEHYWSELLKPGLSLAVRSPSILATEPLPGLSLVTRDRGFLDQRMQSRLDAGQVLIFERDQGIQALMAAQQSPLAIQLEARADGAEIYAFYLYLVKSALDQFVLQGSVQVNLTDAVSKLSRQLNLPLSVLDIEGEQLSEQALESLATQQQFLRLSSSRPEAYVRLVTGEVISFEFPQPFSEGSWWVILVLLVVSILSLAAVVNVLIQDLGRQIKSVESVASRIGRGELDARVKRASHADAVSRLGFAFNSMADHIQRLMFIQKEMIHAVSHELRTPVARIRFGVQMIEDCPDQASLRKQVRGIDGDIQELDELIDEILTYARLEQGGPILAFHECNVKDIVEQVVSEQSSVKPELSIEAQYKTESDLWHDSEVEARYIHRSIQNLVGNATRYAKGKVRIVCSFEKDTCRVDVEDDGPGIPEEQWESVFTPFARLDDSRTRSSGGYGLGLAIVRRILYWHGGQAFLGRSAMGGAKFSLVWPRLQQAPQGHDHT